MRIITGKARGTKLATLEGDNTRPTSERAKEAIFSTLQFDIDGACVLDLFAGSGQMGLEALSRGADSATLCDLSRDAIAVIKKNAEKTRLLENCRVICSDFRSALKKQTKKKAFDLVFLDPPYALGVIPEALELLLCEDLLKVGAKIICEAASFEDVFGKNENLSSCFEVLKQTRYGVACVTILTFHTKEANE